MDEVIKLPYAANETREGPRLELSGAELRVRYDTVVSPRELVWTVLKFSEVLAVQSRSAVSCDEEHVLPSDEGAVLMESPWLDEVRSRWEAAVGWHEYQQARGGAERFRHYRFYFDDACCIDVIASGLLIEQG